MIVEVVIVVECDNICLWEVVEAMKLVLVDSVARQLNLISVVENLELMVFAWAGYLVNKSDIYSIHRLEQDIPTMSLIHFWLHFL